MAFISEDRVDLLEEKLRSKVDTMTGFSDVEGKSRALEKVRDTPNELFYNIKQCVVAGSTHKNIITQSPLMRKEVILAECFIIVTV